LYHFTKIHSRSVRFEICYRIATLPVFGASFNAASTEAAARLARERKNNREVSEGGCIFAEAFASPSLLYASPFLFFFCAFSIGAFRAFLEAISALS
jgi:hypothetical protein